MKPSNEIDSKFRFVIIASERAKQLLKGAKPRIKTKSRNPIRIAQNEVIQGEVVYEVIESKEEKFEEPEEDFIEEEIEEAEEKETEEEKV